MESKNFSELMATLDCLELTAADLMDTVATARAELEQAFENSPQCSNRGVSA